MAMDQFSIGVFITISAPTINSMQQLTKYSRPFTRGRANAIGTVMSFKSTADVHRWCNLQLLSNNALCASCPRLLAWRSDCLALKGAPWLKHNFNALQQDPASMIADVVSIFERMQLLGFFSISRADFTAFVVAVAAVYRKENAYHNFQHAVDVLQMVVHILIECDAISTLAHQSAFIVMIAAICHDVGHPSIRSASTINCNLELFHADLADNILQQHPAILANVTEIAKVRAQIAQCILATDIALDSKWRESIPRGDVLRALVRSDDTSIPLQLIIRSADVSNVARPFMVAAEWSQALSDEIAGSSSQIVNREATIAFCRAVAVPLYELLDEAWPESYHCLASIIDNMDAWTRSSLTN